MEKQPPPLKLIETAAAAAEWLGKIRPGSNVSFDLEADGLYSYEDKICLAQVSAGGECAIIDPLADPEALAPLKRVLLDRSILKIAHGADYDVRLLKKTLGTGPDPVFDTMIAAQMLGLPRLGLAALLEDFFGIILDKKYQRADWSKRPLSPQMLEYAISDVLHLMELAGILRTRLVEKNRLSWAEEEFGLLAAALPPQPKKPWCLDVKGASKMNPRELTVLQALLDLRDDLAKKRNRPAFKIIPNSTLIQWAAEPPSDHAGVVGSEGVSRSLMEKISGSVLRAVEEALALPVERLIVKPKSTPKIPFTPEETRRLERLKAARAKAAEGLGMDPGVLVNSATLEKLARTNGQSTAGLLLTELKTWQSEAVGRELMEALADGQ